MGKFGFIFGLWFMLPMCLLSQDSTSKEELMNVLFDKGYDKLFVNKDSAYHHFNASLKLAKELKDYNMQLDILSYTIYASDYHYDLKNYRKNLEKTQAILESDSLQSKIEDYEVYFNSFLSDKGIYYFETRDFESAKANFQELLFKLSKIPDQELDDETILMLDSMYSYLATIYKHTGKYELSEQYYLRSISLIEKNKTVIKGHEDLISGTNLLLAQLYNLIGQYKKSDALFHNVLRYYKKRYRKEKKFKNNLISVYQKITDSYVFQDSLQQALNTLNEVVEGGYLLKEDPFYKQMALLYGDVYSGLMEDEKALEYYSKALELYQKYHNFKPHKDIVDIQGKFAKFYLERSDYKTGLGYIEKALRVSGTDLKLDSNKNNPDPNRVFSKRQLLNLLDTKMQLQFMGYKATDSFSYLDAAVQTNKDILRTFDLLKKEFDSKLDKQFLAETAYPIFHRMLAVLHTAYQKNHTPELFRLALNIAEKNKDFLLMEALRSTNATQYGGIPKKLLEKEARYRAEINHLEKELFDTTDKANGFSETLFSLKQHYFGFLDSLKQNYPKYHDLKYGNRKLDIEEVRKTLLNDGSTLISYTLTDSFLYALIFNGSDKKFLKLPFTENDKEAVRTFYRLLSSPSIAGDRSEITTLGKRLFDKILKEPLSGFEDEDLTIIADGVLHYLPFDMLWYNEAYLLKSKIISYGNSITSLLVLKEKERTNSQTILAFAPSFDGEVVKNAKHQFGKLVYNDDEVNKINTFFETKIYSNKRATLKNFKARAPDFSIIHLATHAVANDEFPDYSYLAFSKNGEASNILYIKDLYNTSLNADMVTLSACETGIGKLKKGQGMLSLSKGFYYAGARSLVNTLWKINDKSSVRLMALFYEGLGEGKTKKEALRDAKLNYLETTNDDLLRHPYYWSAFVVSGDTTAITTSYPWWIIGIGVLLLIAIGLYLLKKRNPNNC